MPAVVQDATTGRIRMVAYMNEEAYRRTLETGLATFWSRSRGRLWQKGETSGNRLRVERLTTDCDGDAILVLARADGPTCHTGAESCFDAGAADLEVVDPAAPAAAPATAGPTASRGVVPTTCASTAPHAGGLAVLRELERVIAERDRERPAGSYTASLLAAGPSGAGRKVAEEALEAVFAACFEGPERVRDETADLLYHLLVLLRSAGVTLAEVAARLAERRR